METLNCLSVTKLALNVTFILLIFCLKLSTFLQKNHHCAVCSTPFRQCDIYSTDISPTVAHFFQVMRGGWIGTLYWLLVLQLPLKVTFILLTFHLLGHTFSSGDERLNWKPWLLLPQLLLNMTFTLLTIHQL